MSTKKTPLAQTSWRRYNSGVETDYIFPDVRQEKIYVRGRSCWRRGGLLLFNSKS